MPSNTKENGFETLIVNWLVNENGYEQGTNADYNQEYAIDEERLFRYLQSTQPRDLAELRILDTLQKRKGFWRGLVRSCPTKVLLRYSEKASNTRTRRWSSIRYFPARETSGRGSCMTRTFLV